MAEKPITLQDLKDWVNRQSASVPGDQPILVRLPDGNLRPVKNLEDGYGRLILEAYNAANDSPTNPKEEV